MNMNNLKIILLGFLGAFFFFAFKESVVPLVYSRPENIITATGINLVDQQGRIRIQIGFSKQGPPGIWIMDEKGVARLIMGLYEDNTPHIGLQDKNGLMIELMRSFGELESPLLIFKSKGQDMMITGLNPADNTPFSMHYEKDRKRKINFGNYNGP